MRTHSSECGDTGVVSGLEGVRRRLRCFTVGEDIRKKVSWVETVGVLGSGTVELGWAE